MAKKKEVGEPARETEPDPELEGDERATCFVLSVIGDEGTPERRRANQVFKHLIAPVVEELGYAPFRADHVARPGLITSRIIQDVAEADLVVADLTDHNPNVFYELAIRHGLQRPLVQLIDANQSLPFDVAGMRTIFFDIHDLDSVESAREQLAAHIEELEQDDRPVETPVSVARDMKQLWESDNPVARAVAELLSGFSALRAEMEAQRRQQVQAGSITGNTIRAGSLSTIGEGVVLSQADLDGVQWLIDGGRVSGNAVRGVKGSGPSDD